MKNILLWLILPFCFLSVEAQVLTGKVYRAGTNLKWGGSLARQRIGDLLPFEFRSDRDPKDTDTPSHSALPSPADQIANVTADPKQRLAFEKTYLHTDRDVYALGDTLWFKAYLVNAQNNKPINSSNNLYVELIAPDSAKILAREIIRMDNGTGNGDFDLADSIPPGKYMLRAYTNWMRNFGDNFTFQKEITLLRTQATPAPIISQPKIATKKKAKTNSKNQTPATTTTVTAATTPSATIATATPTVRFYPEGGSLVEGISSLVAVKAEDGYGKGIAVAGAILTALGDTAGRFSCDTLGFGIFALLPISGQTYHAAVQFKNEAIFSLPIALSKGPAIHIRQADTLLKVAITTNDTAGAVKPAYKLVVKHAGVTLFGRQFQMPGQQALINIATAAFPEGISAVTLYNDQDKPYCERLIYIHHPANPRTLTLVTDKKAYQPKEQVSVQINAPANSSLSMAVVDAGVVPGQAGDVVCYLQLQSEIKGNIANASRYFDTTNVNRFKQLDLLLLTQGWRNFIWRRLADTAIRISYAAENSISISGKVRDELQNKYLPGLNISLYAPGAKDNKLFATQTDSTGRFNVNGLMLYGMQNISLASVNDKGKNKGSFMVDTVLPLPISKPAPTPAIGNAADSATAVALIKRITDMKNAKVNGTTQLNEVKIKGKQTVVMRDGLPHVIWGPDQVLNIKPEDEEYKTLEWYILQKAKGAFESSPPDPTGVFFAGLVKSFNTALTFQGNIQVSHVTSGKIFPKLFINGVELVSEEYTQIEAYRQLYYNMPIQKIKKIVIRRVANGLADDYLIYLTMPENALVDNPGMLDMNIPGYYQARAFYEPAPNAPPSVADYRATIHWEPNIKTDATGKANISFYNAAPQTNARVIVEGVTADGTPVTAISDYEVKQ